MMRTTLLILATSCLAFAALPAQTTTYVDGNLTGVTPNSGGTLTFDDEKAMHLRTGLTQFAVPYEGVSHAELGAVKTTSHAVAFYKVWERHKPKTETQLLVVNFKNDQGEEKTMTLELARPAAQSILSDLQTRTGKNFGAAQPAKTEVASTRTDAAATSKTTPKKNDPMGVAVPDKNSDPWWGDGWWKTQRNQDKWSKPAGSASSPQGPTTSQQ